MKSTANLYVKLLVTFLLLCKIVFTHSFLSRTPQHIDRGWHKTLWDELPIGHLLIKCNIPQHLYLIHLQKQKTRTYQIQWTLPISTHTNTNINTHQHKWYFDTHESSFRFLNGFKKNPQNLHTITL